MARTWTFVVPLAVLTLSAAPLAAQQSAAQEIVVTANMKVPEGLEPVKMVVGIKDLDLKSVAGVNKLEKRITGVIERFCGPPAKAAKWQVDDSKACSEYAWASARPQMDTAVSRANSN